MNEHYNEGFSAFTEGMDYTDNPYPGASARGTDWADGWTAAHEEAGGDERFFSGEENEYSRYEDWINE